MHFLQNFEKLQLDIVGFLAILGEGSVLSNAQVLTLTELIYIPRLIPAPQALIRPSRPSRLPTTTGQVIGAYSGNVRYDINFIANLIHGEGLPAFTVHCVRVTKNPSAPNVTAKLRGPLSLLVILGCAFSIALLVLSITFNDGMALLATILLSLLSTVVGIGSKWHLELPKRRAKREVGDAADVVIKYPQGSFIVVRCDESVARELYFAPEDCIYNLGVLRYRAVSLLGTLMLMFGVIALGNASVKLQVCFAAAYMLINVGYWIVAALPQRWHWELSSFETEIEHYELKPPVNGNGATMGNSKRADSFTGALWRTIALTGTTAWVKLGHVAPSSRAWGCWLNEAEEVLMSSSHPSEDKEIKVTPIPYWDYDAALTKYLESKSLTNMA
jgi:hypothetical protein